MVKKKEVNTPPKQVKDGEVEKAPETAPEPLEDTTSEPPKTEPLLVDIAKMTTEKHKKSPINFGDNDKIVLEWYNGLSTGERFTLEQAGDILDISGDEVENSFTRLQKTVLPETLTHIVE